MAASIIALPFELLVATTKDLTTQEHVALSTSCKALSSAATVHLYRRVYFAESVDFGSRKQRCDLLSQERDSRFQFTFRDTKIFDIVRFAATIQKWSNVRRYVNAASFSWVSPRGSEIDDAVNSALESLRPGRPYVHILPPYLLPLVVSPYMTSRSRPLAVNELPLARLIATNYPLASVEVQAAHLCPVGPDYEDTGAAMYNLFGLETLRKVKIDCCLPNPVDLFPRTARPDLVKKSGVTHLTLEDFRGRTSELEQMLSWPAGLVVYSLNALPALWKRGQLSNNGSFSPSALARALLPQAESLEVFDVCYKGFNLTWDPRSDRPDDLFNDFRPFTRLQSLGIPHDFFIRGELDPEHQHRGNGSKRPYWMMIRDLGERMRIVPSNSRSNLPACPDAVVDLLQHFPASLRHLQIQSSSSHAYALLEPHIMRYMDRDATRLVPLIEALPDIKLAHLPRLETVEIWEPCRAQENNPKYNSMFQINPEFGDRPALIQADIILVATVHGHSPLREHLRKGLLRPVLKSLEQRKAEEKEKKEAEAEAKKKKKKREKRQQRRKEEKEEKEALSRSAAAKPGDRLVLGR